MDASSWARLALASGCLGCGGTHVAPEVDTTSGISLAERAQPLFEPYLPPSVETEVLEETLLDGYVRRRIRYLTPDETWAPALHLSPVGDQIRPGVLLIHGHDVDAEWFEEEGRALAPALARAGFEVLAPDLRPFAAFDPEEAGHYGSDGLPWRLGNQGDRFVRVVVNDLRAALSVLRDEPRVGTVSVGGQPLGAWLALNLTVVEPAIRATLLSGLFLPLDVLFSTDHHGCQHMRSLYALGDTPGWVAATVRRTRFQIHWGDEDPLYPNGGPDAQNALRGLVPDAISSGRVRLDTSEGLGHDLDVPLHLAFFAEALEL